MEFKDLFGAICNGLIPKLSKNKGLQYFAIHRRHFENWMKVELCSILSKYTIDITPEYARVDIVTDEWAIELKTISTNYGKKFHSITSRGITKKINSIKIDIGKLKSKFKKTKLKKVIAFIVFPLPENTPKWGQQIKKINLKPLKMKEFNFFNKVERGIFYLGLVK